jgi:demethylmenaquinone methyltransferase / 2-methoxy-6-polyprenyl-1,4-benzoquinol methylase
MRPDEIAQMFSQIAHRYDRANHILSFNRDRAWRKILVQHAAPKPGERLLDLCTGTGDVAIEFAKACPEMEIVGLDLSEEMLRVAREKLAQLSLDHRVRLIVGNALELPFAENSFEIVSQAFGLRNLPDRARGLKEIYRVLSPGGRALIVEFSIPQSFLMHAWSTSRICDISCPSLGGWCRGRARRMSICATRLRAFPTVLKFLKSSTKRAFAPWGIAISR